MSYQLYKGGFSIAKLGEKGWDIVDSSFKDRLYNKDHEQNAASVTLKHKDRFSDLGSLPNFMLKWIDSVSSDIIIIVNEEGNVQFISRNVKALLGYEASEIMGTAWKNNLQEENIVSIRKHLLEETGENQRFNINIRNKYGKYISFDCSMLKVKDEQSDDHYFLATLKDITSKKEAEEMMIRSEKMSIAGQLAAGIAHEIRNPLTSMKGFLQLLQAGIDRKEEYYNIMIDEINKIETITSELLFLSKPLTDNKQNEYVYQMVEDVIVLLRPQAKLKNIELKWEKTTDEAIYCDRSQIKQVLINLIKNAIEATTEPGDIEIELNESSNYLKINVIDEGPGISEELLHKLGEPFFTTKQNGTGLGLMITKQILEHHHGHLQIFQNEEKGSTFQVLLPKKDQ